MEKNQTPHTFSLCGWLAVRETMYFSIFKQFKKRKLKCAVGVQLARSRSIVNGLVH